MRRLIKAEVEYLKKRWYWALAVSGGPIAILAGIIPLFLGGVAFDSSETFLIVFIFSWCMIFALTLLIGGQGMRERSETRLKLHLTLPLAKSEVGFTGLFVKVAAIGLLYAPWLLILIITGFRFIDEERTALLLVNGSIIAVYFGTSLVDQIIDISRPHSNAQKTILILLIMAVLMPTVFVQVLINLLHLINIDTTCLSAFHVQVINLIKSLQGAIGLNVIALTLPIWTYIFFMRRKSFVSRGG